MKKIPQKYLRSTNQREARAHIREWLSSGMTVEDMARQLIEKYRSSGAKVREHLGTLLSIIYDFGSPEIARQCAKLFGMPLVDGFSVSESAYISGYLEEESIFKRKVFSETVATYSPVVESFPSRRWPMVVAPFAYNHVLTVSARHNIYALMGADNELILFILNASPDDILIDEEIFGEDEPLYFTEHNHFTSPVFRINLVAHILGYCLTEIGYPHIPVKKKVIFTSQEVNLVNLDDYSNHDDWKDVEVMMLKNVIPNFPINGYSCLLYNHESLHNMKNRLREMLLFSISATALLYEAANNERLTLSMTPENLSALCKRMGIFV